MRRGSWRTACGALLLLACALGAPADARRLAQAPAPGAPDAYVADLLAALDGNASESGPILYKTFEAAYYALVAASPDAQPSRGGDSARVPFGAGSSLLLAWDAGNASLTLAFAPSAADNSSVFQADQGTITDLPYLSGFFAGRPAGASQPAASLFTAALDAANASIASLTGGNGSAVGRVLCAGHSGGGALAQLCGPWAAVTFCSANVRVVSFGAPRYAAQKHDWALQELVDLPYLWLTASDNASMGAPSGILRHSNVTRVIPEGQYSGSGSRGSVQYYATLLNATLKADGQAIPVLLNSNFSYGYEPAWTAEPYLASSAPPGGGIISDLRRAVGTVTDTVSAAVETVRDFFRPDSSSGSGNTPAPAPDADAQALSPGSDASGSSPRNTRGGVSSASLQPNAACAPILCKLQAGIADACDAYSDGASLGPGSVTVSAPEVGTNVAVAWDAAARTATFAWRGSQENEDWVSNLRLGLDTDASSEYFTELYNGTEVYRGELQQFRAVTDQAQTPDSNITAVLERLSGGATPNTVRCIGHSLGGGLATVCGPWAAVRWPTADVRVATYGSPKGGNLQFAESVYATVGRIYRAVFRNDVVPALPPFRRYLHANYALFLDGANATAGERPPVEIDDLVWADHGCEDQYEMALMQQSAVSIPDWVQNLT